jgi:hypothetical protein
MSLQALSRRRSATGPGRQGQAAAPPHLWQNLSSENASTDRPDNGGAGTRPLLIQLAAMYPGSRAECLTTLHVCDALDLLDPQLLGPARPEFIELRLGGPDHLVLQHLHL